MAPATPTIRNNSIKLFPNSRGRSFLLMTGLSSCIFLFTSLIEANMTINLPWNLAYDVMWAQMTRAAFEVENILRKKVRRES